MMAQKSIFKKRALFEKKNDNINLWNFINFRFKQDNIDNISLSNNSIVSSFIRSNQSKKAKKKILESEQKSQKNKNLSDCNNGENNKPNYQKFIQRGQKRSKSWNKYKLAKSKNNFKEDLNKNDKEMAYLDYFDQEVNTFYLKDKNFINELAINHSDKSVKDCRLRRRNSFERIKGTKAKRLFKFPHPREYTYHIHNAYLVNF